MNAIDEDLAGSSQVLRDYRSTTIKPLQGLLNAAAGAERILLLASDHGHVLGEAIEPHRVLLPKTKDGGKRWRPLAPGEEPQVFERVLPAGSWCPQGAERVAAIWDETVAHGHPAYGEHGGLALAEVVAPVLLLAPEWLAELRGEEDSALETRTFPRPGWWNLVVGPEVRVPTSEVVLPQVVLPQVVPQGTQMSLLSDLVQSSPSSSAGGPRPLADPAADGPALVAALRRSKIFQVQVEGQRPAQVEQVLGGLEVLAAGGDALSVDEFARRCQIPPRQVPGRVARMGLLNIDGYALVELDRAARRVVLHRGVLVQQYALPH